MRLNTSGDEGNRALARCTRTAVVLRDPLALSGSEALAATGAPLLEQARNRQLDSHGTGVQDPTQPRPHATTNRTANGHRSSMSNASLHREPAEQFEIELESADSLVGPIELFDRWERQAWTTRDLPMEQDREGWASLGPFTLRELRSRLYQFFLGEAAVTRTLPALALAAPTPEAQCFLATQSGDEARHTIFFLRYLRAVGEADVDEGIDALAERWSINTSTSHSQFFTVALAQATDAVRANPSDPAVWLAGITIYHLLTEAVLAIAGQRAIMRAARRSQGLSVLVQGALNVARDESRHIAFGVRALREGVRGGHGDDIADTVREQIPLLTAILVSPEQRLPGVIGGDALRPLVDEAFASWCAAFDALAKRLRLIGLHEFVTDADALWKSGIRQALDDYSARHGRIHPAAGLSETGSHAVRRAGAVVSAAPAAERNE